MTVPDTMQSSRLIVKNLPKTINETKLRQHFGQKGEVTDVQLKYNDKNQFRGFAFVGYRTAEQALEAQEYFNKTFVGACRVSVEVCKNLAEKPKPASRTFREQEKAEKLKKKAEREVEAQEKSSKRKRKEDEILEKAEEDPSFMEFLQAHKKAAATWGNDTLVDELMKMKKKDTIKPVEKEEDIQAPPTTHKATKAESTEDEDEDEEEGKQGSKKKKQKKQEFFTLKLRDVPRKAKKKDIKAFFAPLKLKSVRFPKGVRGIVYVGFGSESDRLKGLQRNKSVLIGNKIKLRMYDANENNEGEEKPKTRWQKLQEELEKVAEPVGESGRIFMRNLPYTTNEDEVTKLFQEFGPITEVHLPIDKITRRIKGFGFVSFMLPEHADKAFKALDGTVFQGRMLHLLPSKAQDEVGEEINAGSSYKTDKEKKLKKSAGSSHNWNALFLGSSAVSKVISEKYGISREEMLLDKNEEQDNRLASVGVRMALAETEIVSETKKFLEDNGVCLDAFDSNDKNVKPERSKTTLLAKNLPPGTTADDLGNLFTKHGVISRIVLPPSGITGIVEFAEPAEARAAFKKLAYSKFFNVPLYLEWAPVGVFSRAADSNKIVKLLPNTSSSDEVKSEIKDVSDPVAKILMQDEETEPIDENAVPELDTTLFVKNLNFRTQEEPLRKHFVQCGPIYAVTVARKKDPDNADILLSMGYGFVQYYRKKDAEKALANLNGTMLENHILELKRSTRTLVKENASSTAKKTGNSTKILVRNIPFAATQDEVNDLFKTFGKLKAVRLPRKLTGGNEHRGFAFVEYHSESDAKKAFETLCKSTHLYGRRLVLEWAAQDESIEDLRAKTARLASASQGSSETSNNTGSTKKKLQRYFQTHVAKSSTNNDDDDNE